MGLCNFIRRFGWANDLGEGCYIRGHISEIKKKCFDRRDKTYLRNELNQIYHYMKSYTFIIRLLCVTMNTNFDVRKQTEKERTYTLDGLINEERLISSLANGWAYIRGGGLTLEGALTWDFTVCYHCKVTNTNSSD